MQVNTHPELNCLWFMMSAFRDYFNPLTAVSWIMNALFVIWIAFYRVWRNVWNMCWVFFISNFAKIHDWNFMVVSIHHIVVDMVIALYVMNKRAALSIKKGIISSLVKGFSRTTESQVVITEKTNNKSHLTLTYRSIDY